MKIGIDIDGVLTDEQQFIIDWGTKYLNERNIEYKVHKDIYDSNNVFEIDSNTYDDFWKQYLLYYSENIAIRPFASNVITKLKEDGHCIYIITARSYTTYNNKFQERMQSIVRNWLQRNDIKYDKVYRRKSRHL